LNDERLTDEILIQSFIRFEGGGHDYSGCWHKLSRWKRSSVLHHRRDWSQPGAQEWCVFQMEGY